MKIQTHGWMKSGWFWRNWMGKHWDSNHLLLWMCLNFHVFLWYIWSLKTWYVCLASRNARSNDALNVFSRVFSCKRIAVGKAQALRPCIFLGYPQCDRFDTSETMDGPWRLQAAALGTGFGRPSCGQGRAGNREVTIDLRKVNFQKDVGFTVIYPINYGKSRKLRLQSWPKIVISRTLHITVGIPC